jgi:type IV fimbrial biogenesis protein FimT
VLEMKKSSRFARGFTLIELLVALTIGAILMVVAAPSFITYQRNSELTSHANSLLAAINAARGEAMKRGRSAMVVPTDGADWSTGWVVFVDLDRTQDYAAANDLTILTAQAPPSYLTITGRGTTSLTAPYIMYDASGYSRTKAGGFGALTFEIKRGDLSGTEQVSQIRRVKIASTGRARVCTPKTTADAECSLTESAL